MLRKASLSSNVGFDCEEKRVDLRHALICMKERHVVVSFEYLSIASILQLKNFQILVAR